MWCEEPNAMRMQTETLPCPSLASQRRGENFLGTVPRVALHPSGLPPSRLPGAIFVRPRRGLQSAAPRAGREDR